MTRLQFLLTLLSPFITPFIKRKDEQVIYPVDFADEDITDIHHNSQESWFKWKLENEGADWIPIHDEDLRKMMYSEEEWEPIIQLSPRYIHPNYSVYREDLLFIGPDAHTIIVSVDTAKIDIAGRSDVENVFQQNRIIAVKKLRKKILEHYIPERVGDVI